MDEQQTHITLSPSDQLAKTLRRIANDSARRRAEREAAEANHPVWVAVRRVAHAVVRFTSKRIHA